MVDAPQRRLPRHGGYPARGQDGRSILVLHDGTCGVDGLRDRKALHTRGDIDRLTEVVLAVVEGYREAWSLVDADLQDQILSSALLVQSPHRLPHSQSGGQGTVRRREGRHDSVA